jgi:hypothetical protein
VALSLSLRRSSADRRLFYLGNQLDPMRVAGKQLDVAILGGCTTVVNGVGSIRSDAHGQGRRLYRPAWSAMRRSQ